MATIKCMNCGLVNPEVEPVCRRCGEVLVLETDIDYDTGKGGAVAVDPMGTVYAAPAFPPPLLDEVREAARRTGRTPGLLLCAVGVASACAGTLLSMPHFVVGGIGAVIAGWLLTTGSTLGIYFFSLSWVLFLLWAAAEVKGLMSARLIVFFEMVVPSVILVLLWLKLAPRLRAGDPRLRDRYGFALDGQFLPAPLKHEASVALKLAAVGLGALLLGVTAWGAFVREPTVDWKPAAYWVAAAKDPNAAVRRKAMLALTRLNSKDAIPTLTASLNDDDAGVRHDAVEGLRGKSDQEAAKQLRIALWSDYEDVRTLSLEALRDRDLFTAADAELEAHRADRLQPPRK